MTVPELLRLSHSKLSKYEICPLQYKYHYIDKLSGKFQQERPYLSLGTSVHDALHNLFRLKKEERNQDKLIDLLRKSWKREGYSNTEEEREYGNRAVRMLEDFYGNFGVTAEPAYLERFFTVKLSTCALSGKIDRIDRLPDGTYEIIDYKTGRNMKTPDELMSDQQLAIYQLGAERDLAITVSKVSYLYLEQSYKLSHEFAPEKIAETQRDIESWADRINRDTEFNPTPNRLCDFCDYNLICPAMLFGDNQTAVVMAGGSEKDKYELALKQLDDMVKALYLMNAMTKKINNVIETDKLFKLLVKVFKDIAEMRVGILFIKEGNQLVAKTVDGFGKWNEPLTKDWVIPVGKGVIGKAVTEKKHQYLDDCAGHEDFIAFDYSKYPELHNRMKNLAVFPLEVEDDAVGVMALANQEKLGSIYDRAKIIMLLNLAGHAAIAIKNAQNYTAAVIDRLTGIANRSFFENEVYAIVDNLKKNNGYLSLLMIDIDNFKTINDSYGHPVGDLVLKAVAVAVRNSVRPRDLVARYGGEEFVVLLVNAGPDSGPLVAERLRANVEKQAGAVLADGREVTCTVSIGIYSAKAVEVQSLETAKVAADQALYQAKATGRNRVCVAKPSATV